jgi:KUP system potassium uptake protein
MPLCRAGSASSAIGAAGAVFDDNGTSPLYVLKECVDADPSVAATHANLLGLVSLVFWFLTMVVAVKYLTFIMVDNRGEGGILALLTSRSARSATHYFGTPPDRVVEFGMQIRF